VLSHSLTFASHDAVLLSHADSTEIQSLYANYTGSAADDEDTIRPGDSSNQKETASFFVVTPSGFRGSSSTSRPSVLS